MRPIRRLTVDGYAEECDRAPFSHVSSLGVDGGSSATRPRAPVDNGHANPPPCAVMHATRRTTRSQQEPIRATST